MTNIKKVIDKLYWVGGNDRRLSVFEGVYSVPLGVSYNSYLLVDEDVTILFDTVDKAVDDVFFENVKELLKGRDLDYVFVHHMEPDHSATLFRLISEYKSATIVCNAKTKAMIHQFFDIEDWVKFKVVNEGEEFATKNYRFTFVNAPMVHWPEVMMTYEINNGLLFSADAFGTFNALDGAMFLDKYNFELDWVEEARRYYTNIVGKYGQQVTNVLKKASNLKINYILPLHGPVIRGKEIPKVIDLYVKWSSYTPEVDGVLIAFASVYGHTKEVAEALATKLDELNVPTKVMDVSIIDSSYVVSNSFKYSSLVFLSTTYNAGIFIKMEEALKDVVSHNIQNRNVAFIENGSWAATSGKLMKELFKNNKDIRVIESNISIKSKLSSNQVPLLDELAKNLRDVTLKVEEPKAPSNPIFDLSYGLYVVSSSFEGVDNACIVNTVSQQTDTPLQVSVTINKNNLTHDLVLKSKVFNASILDTTTTFDLIKHFGFNSGRTFNKFEDTSTYDVKRSEVTKSLYLNKHTISMLEVKVVKVIDLGTHSMFIGELVASKNINEGIPLTYLYYINNIKPKVKKPAGNDKPKGYVCKICGYVHESDTLPDDFICPLCKHGVDAFEKL